MRKTATDISRLIFSDLELSYMERIELAQFTTPYEFEERASFFSDMVLTLARRYRSFDITVGNLTLEKMLELQKSIAKVAPKKNKLLEKLYVMEHKYQVESANQNAVIVTLYAHTRRPIISFEKKIEAAAKAFRGIRRDNPEEIVDFGDDPDEENYRFVANFIYDFKA